MAEGVSVSREGRTLRNILVTGRPGCGKTTLVLKVVRELAAAGFKARGFVTEEMREGSSRVGFMVRDLAGETAVLAHAARRVGPRVGKYGVDTLAFERVALRALDTGDEDFDLLVVDEIGRMELCSDSFRSLLPGLFDSPLPLLATVQAGDNPLTRRLLEREDVRVHGLSVSNRDEIAGVIYEELLSLLAEDGVCADPEGGTEP